MLSTDFMRLRLSYDQLDTTHLKEKTDLFLRNVSAAYCLKTSPHNVEIPADSPLLRAIAELEQLQRAPQLIRVKASRRGKPFSSRGKGSKIIVDLFFSESGLSDHGKAYFDIISKRFGQDELIAEIIEAVKLKLEEKVPALKLDGEASDAAIYQVDFDKGYHLLNLFVGKSGLWPNFDIRNKHTALDDVEEGLFQVAINTINVYLVKKTTELKVKEAEQVDDALKARYDSSHVVKFMLNFKDLFKLFTDFYDQLSEKFGRQLTSNEFDDFVSWFFWQHLNYLLFDTDDLAHASLFTITHAAELSLRISKIIDLLDICKNEFVQLATFGGCFKQWHTMHETLIRNLKHVKEKIKQRHDRRPTRASSCPNLLVLSCYEEEKNGPEDIHTPPSSPRASQQERPLSIATPARAVQAHKITPHTVDFVDTRPVSLTIKVFERYTALNEKKKALRAKATVSLNETICDLLSLSTQNPPTTSTALREAILALAGNIVEITKLEACLDVCSQHLAAAMPDLQKLDTKIAKIRGPNGLESGIYNRVREQFVSEVLRQRQGFANEKSLLRNVCDYLKNIPPPERLNLPKAEQLRLQQQDLNVNSLFLDIVQLCDKPNIIQKSCDRVLANLIQGITRCLVEFTHQDDVKKQHESLTVFKALFPEIQDCRQWYKRHNKGPISDNDKLEGATKIQTLHLAILLRIKEHPCLSLLLVMVTSAKREFMHAAGLISPSAVVDKANDEYSETKSPPPTPLSQVRVSPQELDPTIDAEKEKEKIKETQDNKLVVIIKKIIDSPYWNHKGYRWWFDFSPKGIEKMRKLRSDSLEGYVNIAKERKDVDVGSRRSQLVSDLYNTLISKESFSDKYQRLEKIENFLLNRGDVLPPSPDEIYNLQFEC